MSSCAIAQRYLDLIMNPQSRETLRRRSRVVAAMRTWLLARNYLEVETPMLHTIPGRCGGQAVYHAPQRARYRSLPAHRAGTAFEAAGGRRVVGEGVRDQSLLSQRGAVAAPQPRIHFARTLRGLCRLHRYDVADRGIGRPCRGGRDRQHQGQLSGHRYRSRGPLAAQDDGGAGVAGDRYRFHGDRRCHFGPNGGRRTLAFR